MFGIFALKWQNRWSNWLLINILLMNESINHPNAAALPYTWQHPDLFGALQNLLCGRGGQDGPVASWTELQAHREAGHQLDPQLRDGHFVIHHCDGLLCQDWVWQRRQHLAGAKVRHRDKGRDKRKEITDHNCDTEGILTGKEEEFDFLPQHSPQARACRAITCDILVWSIRAALFCNSDSTYCIACSWKLFHFLL